LARPFQSTRDRFAATGDTVLVFHDTTEFNYHLDNIRSIGILHRRTVGRERNGQLRHYVVCGIQMHSSLAVATDGLPLGLVATKSWTRSKFRYCNALK
jgi:acyl carrier protein phosphodiesterase